MKKFKNVLILSILLLLVLGNSSFATSTSDTAISYTKYIAIGIAALIVILLLFLGYKMDAKDPGEGMHYNEKKRERESREEQEADMIREDTEYEADASSYETDSVNTNDLVETKEYNEDEEDLFSYKNDENSINTPDSSEDMVNFDNETDGVTKEEEEYGEEFDTSIIDSIDDEDDFDSKINNEINSKNDEIDDLVNPPIDDEEVASDLIDSETDFNINDINVEETKFEGFSVNNATEENEEGNKIKPKRKYTKVKSTKKTDSEEFLDQIEENLKEQKNKRTGKTKK